MSAEITIDDRLPLPNSKVKIPRIGFGVYKSEPSKCITSCLVALGAGYRHIDTAQYYGNEIEVGEALRRSGLKRSEVFITTKILSSEGSVHATYARAIESVNRIDGENGYVDLFMIHTSTGGSRDRKEMYLALEKVVELGKAKSIGVSNWGIGHIEELKGLAKIYPPHVNQLELHPFCQQREIVEFCHKNNIIVQAYCPLIRNQKAKDPTLVAIAGAHKKTVSQILIRYSIQKNWVPLPKSDTPHRIEENIKVFDFSLSSDEMKTLDDLDKGIVGSIVMVVPNTLLEDRKLPSQ